MEIMTGAYDSWALPSLAVLWQQSPSLVSSVWLLKNVREVMEVKRDVFDEDGDQDEKEQVLDDDIHEVIFLHF